MSYQLTKNRKDLDRPGEEYLQLSSKYNDVQRFRSERLGANNNAEKKVKP